MQTKICVLLPAVSEHAYSLAQNLDPTSEGRGVLQFKTGLMSVIKVLSFNHNALRISFSLSLVSIYVTKINGILKVDILVKFI